uniref:alpha-glucosidase n=1 Tax=Oryza punctata TaxID=4537 RepID=A0A0E0LEN1_ORYPU
MATRARPLVVLLCLCCLASCLSLAIVAVADAGNGYRTTSFLVDEEGRRLRAELAAVSSAGGGSTAAYGDDVQRLDVYASLETDSRLHVRIADADGPRWEVPQDVIPRPTPEFFLQTSRPGRPVLSTATSDLTFAIHASPFRFTVTRRSTGDVLFDTTPTLVFKDRYLELTSSLPADRASLYGLGEQTKRTFRLQRNDTFTLWNSDIAAGNVDLNLYGSHPFYMDVRSAPPPVGSRRGAGDAHGVLLLNSNGMDVIYGGSYVTYKVIGGVLDFYFFAGPSPLAVVDQYTQLIGRPAPMPYCFGLFGIPMIGADICGFGGNTNEELCSRWIQLGAFYPFSRDHSAIGTVRRELYLWESVARSARKALGLRYRLLPFFYTLMYESHTTGAPIARPLFFSYPGDVETYGIDSQFMLGRGVLVSPVLEPGATTVTAYFPAGRWFSLYDFSLTVATKTGKRVTLPAPADTVNVHVAGGNILPLQQPALTSSRVRQSVFHLLVALADDGTATGDLFLDDGESPEMVGPRSRWSQIKFSGATESGGVVRVRSHVVHDSYAPSRTLVIGKVVLMGLQSPAPPKGFAVYANGVHVNASTAVGAAAGSPKNGALGVAHVGGLSLTVGQEFDLKVVMTY